MSKGPDQGTLDYLTDAAYLMRASAPETSAHLMSQRNHLLLQHNEFPTDIERQRVCTCCGFIMLPGHSAEMKLEAHRARPPKRSQHQKANQANRRSSGPTKVLTCNNCHRSTRIQLSAPPAPVRSRKVLQKKAQKPSPAQKIKESNAKPASAANSSSKKRAKNRKAGLQALLNTSQQQRNKSFSLADFT